MAVDLKEKSRAVFANTEKELRKLIADAAATSSYDELAFVLQLSRELERIAADFDRGQETRSQHKPTASPITTQPSPGRSTDTSPRSRNSTQQKRRAKKNGYPKFHRDGEAIVKVGWSRSKKSEYEHRARFEAVEAVARAITATNDADRFFQIEDVLDHIASHTPDNIPSYQTYAVIAWLRSVGAVTREGKRGYRTISADLSSDITKLTGSTGRRPEK